MPAYFGFFGMVLGWLVVSTTSIHAATTINKVIRIQPIQVCSDDDSFCANTNRILFEGETRKIWEQAGVQIEFLPWNTFRGTLWLDLGVSLFGDDYTVFTLSNIPNHGQHPDPNVINAWFVRSIGGGGYYGHSWQTTPGVAERNGIAVANNVFASNAGVDRRDIIAHEIGHNLGLDHTTLGAGAASNVMSSGRQVPGALADIYPDGASLDYLNATQISQARSTSFATEPVILEQPASQTVKAGSNVTFTALVGGTSLVRYRWRFGQTNLLGWTTNRTITLTNVQLGQAGSYRVVASNLSGVVTSAVATLTIRLDSDGDGLPDAWELANGLNPDSAADAPLDNDQDGLSNLAEYLVGTDPNDPNSLLKVEKFTPPAVSNTVAIISFLAIKGRSYAVQHRPDLEASSWQTLTNVLPTMVDQPVTVQDFSAGAQSQRFYRLISPAP